ncbi:hypothetical protein BHE74_00031219 [Ensete ventricosum]|nr:hypothetical protein BHE74_00031219 [Ensete ventricosum]
MRCRCWRSPLQAATLAGGASARRLPSYGRRTRSRPPLAGWSRAIVCRPLAAAPAAWLRVSRCSRSPICMGALATAAHPLAGGQPPLQGGWPEIVYPCIPDPDGEDGGGQASSSLAVSTRWISAAKLLQSGLATLAQREGGE